MYLYSIPQKIHTVGSVVLITQMGTLKLREVR